MDDERLIANAQLRIKGQTRQRHPPDAKPAIVLRHSRPSTPALAELDGQPHDRRQLASHPDEASGSALDETRHIGRSPSDKTTVSLADENAVVSDQRAERAHGARARHKGERQRAFAGT
jgi:hypothetical protein